MSLPFIFNFGTMLTDCLGYRSCMIIHLCIIPDQMHLIFIIRPIMIISHKIEKKGKRREENHLQQRCKGSEPRKKIGHTDTIKEAKKGRSCRHRMQCGRSITFHNVRKKKVKDGQLNILDVDLPFYIRRHPLLFFALPARRLGLTVILCQLQIPVGTDKV